MLKGKKNTKCVYIKIMGSELIIKNKTENKTFHCEESEVPTY